MPLIRYELGDYAQVGEACSCGRGLPVLDRVIGGLRNMLTLPGGERTWPRLSTYTLADMPAIRQAQFVQREIGAIDLRLVVSRPLTDAEEAKLTRVIRDSLGHPFDIRFVYVERIERSAGGKFEDFLSQLPPGSA
jgi:phenylacetate-CoA ligase